MQAVKAQLDQQASSEGATALLELVAALGAHMRDGKELNHTTELIACVVLASHVADAWPAVAAVAATGLQGEARPMHPAPVLNELVQQSHIVGLSLKPVCLQPC